MSARLGTATIIGSVVFAMTASMGVAQEYVHTAGAGTTDTFNAPVAFNNTGALGGPAGAFSDINQTLSFIAGSEGSSFFSVNAQAGLSTAGFSGATINLLDTLITSTSGIGLVLGDGGTLVAGTTIGGSVIVGGTTGLQAGPNATVTIAAGGEVTGTTSDGINFFDAGNTLTNAGDVLGGGLFGVTFENDLNLINQAGGTITGTTFAGVVSATPGANLTGSNAGTITGPTSGIQLQASGAGFTFTNAATGIIEGTGAIAFGFVVDGEAGAINGTLTNEGQITGTGGGSAISFQDVFTGLATVNNQAGGDIGGASNGVLVSAGGDLDLTLNNTGAGSTVTGAGSGVFMGGSTGTLTVANTGGAAITGGTTGIGFQTNAGPAFITNSGTITGTAGFGFDMTATDSFLSVDNLVGGTISGLQGAIRVQGLTIFAGVVNNAGALPGGAGGEPAVDISGNFGTGNLPPALDFSVDNGATGTMGGIRLVDTAGNDGFQDVFVNNDGSIVGNTGIDNQGFGAGDITIVNTGVLTGTVGNAVNVVAGSAAMLADVTNSGALTGATNGVNIDGANGVVNNQAGGIISGTAGAGVRFTDFLTLNNVATITGGTAGVLGEGSTLSAAITNSGPLALIDSGAAAGVAAIDLQTTGGANIASINNVGGATIRNDGLDAASAAIRLQDTGGGLLALALTNIGGSSILGQNGTGVFMDGFGTGVATITNDLGSTISGATGIGSGAAGIGGATTAISNSGAVAGTVGAGIGLSTTSGGLTINNLGLGATITGNTDGAAFATATGTLNVVNEGTVTGTTGNGLAFTGTNMTAIVTNAAGATIQGAVDGISGFAPTLNFTLGNTGLVTGGTFGVDLSGDYSPATLTATITNIIGGVISGGTAGVNMVDIAGGDGNQVVTVTNAGSIVGGSGIIDSGFAVGSLLVTNAATGTITGTASDGIFFEVAGIATKSGEIVNSGAIAGAVDGIDSIGVANLIVTNQPGASIAGTAGNGVAFTRGLTLVNGGAVVGGTDGVHGEGVDIVANITNNNFIQGGDDGVELTSAGSTTFDIQNAPGAVITATTGAGISINDTAGGTLSGILNNEGTIISGAGDGMLIGTYSGGTLDITNQVGALISGFDSGIDRTGGAGGLGATVTTLVNAGTIQGLGNFGAAFASTSGSLTVTNSGAILGTGNALDFETETGPLVVTNNGIILSFTGNGIDTTGTDFSVTVTNNVGATIAGNIDGIRADAPDLLFQLTNAGTVTGETNMGVNLIADFDATSLTATIDNLAGGTISGAVAGVNIEDTGGFDGNQVVTINNAATAVITGATGIRDLNFASGSLTVNNSGSVTGTTLDGMTVVGAPGATKTMLVNNFIGGAITGGDDGISTTNIATVTLFNQGLVQGIAGDGFTFSQNANVFNVFGAPGILGGDDGIAGEGANLNLSLENQSLVQGGAGATSNAISLLSAGSTTFVINNSQFGTITSGGPITEATILVQDSTGGALLGVVSNLGQITGPGPVMELGGFATGTLSISNLGAGLMQGEAGIITTGETFALGAVNTVVTNESQILANGGPAIEIDTTSGNLTVTNNAPGLIQSLGGDGVSFDTQTGTLIVTNASQILAGGTGIAATGTDFIVDITNGVGATIEGVVDGIRAGGADLNFTLTNRGLVQGNTNDGVGLVGDFDATSLTASIVNLGTGTITGLVNAVNITDTAGGDGNQNVAILNQGEINGGTGINDAGFASGLLAITNQANITGTVLDAISVTGAAGGTKTVQVNNTSAILGQVTGIDTAEIGLLDVINTSTITGTTGLGISLVAAGTSALDVENSGIIVGAQEGIRAAVGTLTTTIVNSNLITGTAAEGIELQTAGAHSLAIANEAGAVISTVDAAADAVRITDTAGGSIDGAILNSGLILAAGTGNGIGLGGYGSGALLIGNDDTGIIQGGTGIGSVGSMGDVDIEIVNDNAILGTSADGIEVQNTGGSLTVTNADTGGIIGTGGDGITLATVTGTLDILNDGLISGAVGNGVSLDGTTSATLLVENTDGASILGAVNGILAGAPDLSATVTNAGTIFGAAGAGIGLVADFDATSLNATIDNLVTGTITGAAFGIQMQDTAGGDGNQVVTITNAGLIEGATGIDDTGFATGSFALTNSGDVFGLGGDAVNVEIAAGGTKTVAVANTGTIQGLGNGIETINVSTVTITNENVINGLLADGATLTGLGAATAVTVTNTPGATLAGNSDGLALGGAAGAAGTVGVTNGGTISGAVDSGIFGIGMGSIAVTVDNTGDILGQRNGVLIFSTDGDLTVTNAVTGQILGTDFLGVGLGTTNAATLTVDNAGSIEGANFGVAQEGAGGAGHVLNVTNAVSGSIVATGPVDTSGISATNMSGLTATVTNDGLVSGGTVGIFVQGDFDATGLVATIGNSVSGTIMGGADGSGIELADTGAADGTQAVTITNDGVVTGGTGIQDIGFTDGSFALTNGATGLVTGTVLEGVLVSIQPGGTKTVAVSNAGLIDGATDGIETENVGTVVVINSGTISGAGSAFIAAGDFGVPGLVANITNDAGGVMAGGAGAAIQLTDTTPGIGDQLVTVVNNGTITGASGISDIGFFSGSFDLTNGGDVIGTVGDAVEITLAPGGFKTVTVGNTGNVVGDLGGIDLAGRFDATVTNSGTIAGANADGYRQATADAGLQSLLLDNQAGGEISGATNGVALAGDVTVLTGTNAGLISGGTDGLTATGTNGLAATLDNLAGATIQSVGVGNGVSLDAGTGTMTATVNNDGTIISASNNGLQADGGLAGGTFVVNNAATGVIEGGPTGNGIDTNFGAAVATTITNAGVITGQGSFDGANLDSLGAVTQVFNLAGATLQGGTDGLDHTDTAGSLAVENAGDILGGAGIGIRSNTPLVSVLNAANANIIGGTSGIESTTATGDLDFTLVNDGLVSGVANQGVGLVADFGPLSLIASITNNAGATIQGGTTGIAMADIAGGDGNQVVTITNAGAITGGATGIADTGFLTGSLTIGNTGSITGGTNDGIFVAMAAGGGKTIDLTNDGQIVGGLTGATLVGNNTITIVNTDLIQGLGDDGVAISDLNGALVQITNSGLVTGAVSGVRITDLDGVGSGVIIVDNTGTLQGAGGDGLGIFNNDGTVVVNNTGVNAVMNGLGGDGMHYEAGTGNIGNVQVVNQGLFQGSSDGIDLALNSAVLSTIDNQGGASIIGAFAGVRLDGPTVNMLVTNAGLIQGGQGGIVGTTNLASYTLSLTNTGTVLGGALGAVDVTDGNADMIVDIDVANTGTMQGAQGISVVGIDGGDVDITNSSLINGTAGDGISLVAGAAANPLTIDIINLSQIFGTTDGIGLLTNANAQVAILNNNLIQGGQDGIDAEGQNGGFILTNNSVIRGNGGDGVDIDGAAVVTNNGLIDGNAGDGVQLGAGTVTNALGATIEGQVNGIQGTGIGAVAVENSGTVRGVTGTGILTAGAFDDVVTNNGIIIGGNGFAANLSDGNDLVTLNRTTGQVFSDIRNAEGDTDQDGILEFGAGTADQLVMNNLTQNLPDARNLEIFDAFDSTLAFDLGQGGEAARNQFIASTSFDLDNSSLTVVGPNEIVTTDMRALNGSSLLLDTPGFDDDLTVTNPGGSFTIDGTGLIASDLDAKNEDQDSVITQGLVFVDGAFRVTIDQIPSELDEFPIVLGTVATDNGVEILAIDGSTAFPGVVTQPIAPANPAGPTDFLTIGFVDILLDAEVLNAGSAVGVEVLDVSFARLMLNAQQLNTAEQMVAGNADGHDLALMQFTQLADDKVAAAIFLDGLSGASTALALNREADRQMDFGGEMHSCGAEVSAAVEATCVYGQFDWRIAEFDRTDQVDFQDSTASVVLGGQMEVAPGIFLGAAVGFDSYEVESGPSIHDGRAFRGGLVAKYADQGFTAGLGLSVGFGQTDSTRRTGFPGQLALGDYDSLAVEARVNLAYTAEFDGFFVKPSIQGAVTHVRQDGFTETGAGLNNLIVAEREDTFFSVLPQVEAGADILFNNGQNTFRPYVRAGVQVVSGSDIDTSAQLAGAPGTSFTATTEFDNVTGVYAIGGTVFALDDFAIKIEYGGQVGADTLEHRIDLKANINF